MTSQRLRLQFSMQYVFALNGHLHFISTIRATILLPPVHKNRSCHATIINLSFLLSSLQFLSISSSLHYTLLLVFIGLPFRNYINAKFIRPKIRRIKHQRFSEGIFKELSFIAICKPNQWCAAQNKKNIKVKIIILYFLKCYAKDYQLRKSS